MPKEAYKAKRKETRGYSLSPENIAWIESTPKGKQSDFVDAQLTIRRLEIEQRERGEYGATWDVPGQEGGKP